MNSRLSSVCYVGVMLVCLAGAVGRVYGQVNVWINTNPGTLQWETASNWSLTNPPASGQSIFITNFVNALIGNRSRTEQIDSTTVASPSTMTVSNVTVSGVGSGLGASHNNLFLNNAGTAILVIQDSLTITPNGTVNITNSTLFIQNDLFIDSGLFLNTGTLVTDSDVCGPLFCIPIGALTTIGHGGSGTLNMTDGRWDSGPVQLGSSSITFGTLIISGGSVTMEGAFVTDTPLNVVNGTVWLNGGTLDINGIPTIGSAIGEVGQMVISNGTWIGNTSVYLGENGGMGTITIEGGTVNQPQLFVGVGAGGSGAIVVDGGLVMISVLHLGHNNVGQMVVSNGVVQSDDVYLGYNAGSEGTLTVVGGSDNVYGTMYLSPTDCSVTGVVVITGGSLNVTNSTGTAVLQVNSGTLELDGGTLRVDTLILTNCARFVRTGGTLIYGSVVLDPNGDADGDGIPNGYEQSHGLDPLDPSDANKDKDGDGMSNLQEYLAGTDPANSVSSFHITSVVRTNNDIRITWMMGSGRTNALQATVGAGNGSYSSNAFTTIYTVTNTIGIVTNYLDVGGATNKPARYYRVRLVP